MEHLAVQALISGFFGVVAAGIGGATLLLARRFNVDYLRYQEELRQVEREAACSHSLVVSKRTDPFCDKCGKVFSQAEAARYSILTCSHNFDVEIDFGKTVILSCIDCGLIIDDEWARNE